VGAISKNKCRVVLTPSLRDESKAPSLVTVHFSQK